MFWFKKPAEDNESFIRPWLVQVNVKTYIGKSKCVKSIVMARSEDEAIDYVTSYLELNHINTSFDVRIDRLADDNNITQIVYFDEQ